LHLLRPDSQPAAPAPRYEVERLLREGTEEQRQRALGAMRALDAVLHEFNGEHQS
jgi:hypothetical protein